MAKDVATDLLDAAHPGEVVSIDHQPDQPAGFTTAKGNHMDSITHPTTRRLVVCGYKPGMPGVAPDDPRLALREVTGWHYAATPVNELRIIAQTDRDWAVLSILDDEDLCRRQTRQRFGTWGRYSATLYVVRTVLGELAWQLTDDERALIDSLEAYGVTFITKQANAA